MLSFSHVPPPHHSALHSLLQLHHKAYHFQLNHQFLSCWGTLLRTLLLLLTTCVSLVPSILLVPPTSPGPHAPLAPELTLPPPAATQKPHRTNITTVALKVLFPSASSHFAGTPHCTSTLPCCWFYYTCCSGILTTVRQGFPPRTRMSGIGAFHCLWACHPVSSVFQSVILQFLTGPGPQVGLLATHHCGALHGSQGSSCRWLPAPSGSPFGRPHPEEILPPLSCTSLDPSICSLQNVLGHLALPTFSMSAPFKQTKLCQNQGI